MRTADEALDKAIARLAPSERDQLLRNIEQSEEVVIFGSYAYGCETERSDLDVLLVGKGRQRKSNNLDMIWVTKEKLRQKTWLRTELASHVAMYGVWLKGEGNWRHSTEISKATINKKKVKVLCALSHLYVKRTDLAVKTRVRLLSSIVIDIFRLSYLVQRQPVPPTSLVKHDHYFLTCNSLISLTDELLGKAGVVLLKENLAHVKYGALCSHIACDCCCSWDQKLHL